MDRTFIDNKTLTEPRLYIIMRSDLYQMNPGKGMAQACHAQALFSADATRDPSNKDAFSQWEGDRGFGTTITLSATFAEMQDIQTAIGTNAMSRMVVDPTYPFSNHYGEYFTTSEITCMYVFADTNIDPAALRVLQDLPLHP